MAYGNVKMNQPTRVPDSHESYSVHVAWGHRPICLKQLNFLPKGLKSKEGFLLNLVDGNMGKHQILLKLKRASSGSSAQSEALLNET